MSKRRKSDTIYPLDLDLVRQPPATTDEAMALLDRLGLSRDGRTLVRLAASALEIIGPAQDLAILRLRWLWCALVGAAMRDGLPLPEPFFKAEKPGATGVQDGKPWHENT